MSETLTKVESFQYPRAHSGHLNEAQNKLLDEFKSLCEKSGHYKPAGPGQKRPTHDDETLLRYLRARKFVPKDAFGQFKDTEEWRKSNQIDNLYNTIDVDEYDESRKLYPQWTGRRDRRGIPLYVFPIAPLTTKRLSEYDNLISKNPHAIHHESSKTKISPRMLRLFALYENLVEFVLPLCSSVPSRPYTDTPVSQSNNIVDVSGVGPKQFWNLKSQLQEASQLATAHYPETLDRIFIIGAPSFFPTIWSWLKRWFDPITVSKIFVLTPANTKSTLETYVNLQDIPKKYGGTLDWEWGQLPNLDPEISKHLTWQHAATQQHGRDSFPKGPVRWRTSPDGGAAAVAVGRENGKQRDMTVALLRPLESGPEQEMDRIPPELPLPSTSGEHTHPSDSQEHFPQSGQTPPESTKSLPRRNSNAVDATPAEEEAAATGFVPAALTESQRSGTSATRFEQQNQTHAAGQLSEGTPAVTDYGHGDKTVQMEPGTVGQAHKDVASPEARADEGAKQPGYVESAKAAVGSAVGAAQSMGTSAMAATGLSNAAKEEKGMQQEQAVEKKVKDEKMATLNPKVDRMGNKQVEDFIRGQYASEKSVGQRKFDDE